MFNKRYSHLLWLSPFAACMGLIAFFGVASNPRFESIHRLDVIRLMTAGAGFAVAIAALLLYLIRPNFRLEDKNPAEKSGQK